MYGLNNKNSLQGRVGFIYRRLVLMLLVCLQFYGLPLHAQESEDNGSSRNISQAEAAQKARDQYGGKVLKVTGEGDTYQIRLLLPSGTVKTVTISAKE